MLILNLRAAIVAFNSGRKVDISALSKSDRNKLIPVAYRGRTPIVAGAEAPRTVETHTGLTLRRVSMESLSKGPCVRPLVSRGQGIKASWAEPYRFRSPNL